MHKINNSIRCSINSCKHHNASNYCELKEILVGGKQDSRSYSTTVCESFCLKDC